jgi:hypothetical protein
MPSPQSAARRQPQREIPRLEAFLTNALIRATVIETPQAAALAAVLAAEIFAEGATLIFRV